VTLLGTGGPRPDPARHGPALLVHVADDQLLFDAGRGVVLQLVRAGAPLAHVGPVFLTHHHFDHIVDLADVMLTSWLAGRERSLSVIGPAGTRAVVAALLERVYDKDIQFRSQGEPAIGGWKPVDAHDAEPGVVHEGRGWRVIAEHVVHGHGLDFSADFRHRWRCFGYRVETPQGILAISGDTVQCEGLSRLARGADVLVQCCYLATAEITTDHMRQVARHTLACGDTVGAIARDAGVKRLVLTHFRQKSSTMLQTLAAEVRRDYDGEVLIGEDLLSVEV
jgi:ribonuclease Z